MKDLLKSHVSYYLSLGILLSICFVLFFVTANQPSVRIVIFSMMTILYVFWGVAHHMVHHDVSVKIVLEYVLMGALGMSLAVLLTS